MAKAKSDPPKGSKETGGKKARKPGGSPENSGKRRSPLSRLFRWTMALVAVAVIAAAGIGGYAYWQYTKNGPLQQAKLVFIPKGSTVGTIAQRLKAEGVLSETFFFELWVRIQQKRLRHGEFRFPKFASQKEVVYVLVEGKVIARRFPVPEGLTSWQIIQRLNRVKNLVGPPITRIPAEGSLLPSTYEFFRGQKRTTLLRKMQGAMSSAIETAWGKRQTDLPIKTKREMVILASIIEKETSLRAERRRVAAVFVNRLRKGMLLQTDPTVIYAITKGEGPLGRRLLRRDLRVDDPYNTYKYKGLPPGPIANPGKAALEAAVNPIKSEELYFVADGTGGHAFAKTLKEHQANVRKWRKIRARIDEERKRRQEKRGNGQ